MCSDSNNSVAACRDVNQCSRGHSPDSSEQVLDEGSRSPQSACSSTRLATDTMAEAECTSTSPNGISTTGAFPLSQLRWAWPSETIRLPKGRALRPLSHWALWPSVRWTPSPFAAPFAPQSSNVQATPAATPRAALSICGPGFNSQLRRTLQMERRRHGNDAFTRWKGCRR
jgi:hypothetical protein